MKLIRNIMMTLAMVYSLASIQVSATEDADDNKQVTQQTANSSNPI